MMSKTARARLSPKAALEAAIGAGKIYARVDDFEGYCKFIKMSPATLYRRRRQPTQLTIAELKRIARTAGVRLGELAEQIGG